MHDGPPRPAFHAANVRRLKRAGLAGRHIVVELSGERLLLRGAEQGEMTIALSDIERMRVGYIETESAPSFDTLLWRSGEPDPISLSPMRPLREPAPYAAAVRDIAADLAQRRGLEAIETGSSPAYWWSLILAMAVLTAGAAGLAFFVVAGPGEPWWGPLAVIAFPLLFLLLVVRRYVKVHRPRVIGAMAELEAHLPPLPPFWRRKRPAAETRG